MYSIQFKYLYTVQGYVTFSVHVHSQEFSGASNFCLSEEAIRSAIVSLSDIYERLQGEYEIWDSDSDDYLIIKSLSYGHFSVFGQLGGSYNAQYLKYELQIDQTDLKQIIENFQRFLKPICEK